MAGRPRKDTIELHSLIINLAELGLNNTEIARVTGVSLRTVQNYLQQSDLGNAVNEVRRVHNALDEEKKAALNKAALAAVTRLLKKRKSLEETVRTDENGDILYTEKRVKVLEPNAGIAQFVLKNTDPKNWSDTPAAQETQEEEDTELRIIIDDSAQ